MHCLRLKAKLAKEKKKSTESQDVAWITEFRNIFAIGCENIWLADSGAYRHMTFNINRFKDSQVTGCNNRNVQIEDNSFVKVGGVGSIEILAFINGTWQPRTIENIFHIPNLKKNLFSVGAVTSKGYKVTFEDGKIVVSSGDVFAEGVKMENQCYKMLIKNKTVEQANVASEQEVKL